MRGDVEEAIGDVAGEDSGGIRALAQSDGEADDITADDRRKEERSEEAAEIALR